MQLLTFVIRCPALLQSLSWTTFDTWCAGSCTPGVECSQPLLTFPVLRIRCTASHHTGSPAHPQDTCGAGDAYAAGFIYGLLNGFDVPSMGRAAARVASIIISRSGASLAATEAEQLAAELPLSNHRELSLAPQQSQQHSDSR